MYAKRVAGLVAGQWSYEYSYNVGFSGEGFIVRKWRFHTLGETSTDIQSPTTP